MKNTFLKEERLCNKREIDSLFRTGSSFLVYPFRIVYQIKPGTATLPKVLISVSKKRMKRAVDRNKVKRKSREAYRQLKYILTERGAEEDKNKRLYFALQYIANEDLSFAIFNKSIQKALKKLKNEMDKHTVE